jgi:hypothetical protein
MKWIGTQGGPLLLLPQSLVKLWGGCVASYTAVYYLSNDGATAVTDYDRACNVSGAAGLLQLGTEQCMVFGNECCQATWIPATGSVIGYLVRWLYADGEDSILSAVSTLSENLFQEPGLQFITRSGPLLLTDSAIPGKKMLEGNSLMIDLPSGQYRVQTELFQSRQQLGLLLHRFTKY